MSDIPGEGEGPTMPVANVREAEEVTTVLIKVNGVSVEVTKKVVVTDILAQAKEAGCFGGAVDEYVIERVSEEGELVSDQTIVVVEAEEFLAVPIGKTEVA